MITQITFAQLGAKDNSFERIGTVSVSTERTGEYVRAFTVDGQTLYLSDVFDLPKGVYLWGDAAVKAIEEAENKAIAESAVTAEKMRLEAVEAEQQKARERERVLKALHAATGISEKDLSVLGL
jgi:hypothetical protein